MKPAKISFKNGVAYSDDFGDTYFSVDDPIAESEYVFASALDEIWDEKDSFIIAEAGFGAGLNFLSTLAKFKDSEKNLHFVSIEANPISPSDLAQIYTSLGVSAELFDPLLFQYPPLIRGFHRLHFFGARVTLTLCFGDIAEILPELDFYADIWYMDGFAPAKNGSMWSAEVCRGIANLSRHGATLCTYSAAKSVQNALLEADFSLNLLKGHGRKRQMIRAKFNGLNLAQNEPWFSRYESSNELEAAAGAMLNFGVNELKLRINSIQNLDCQNTVNQNLRPKFKPKTALIIGGGVAGCVCAFKLKELGVDVTIAEKQSDIATNGSGNHCGILMPLITKPDVWLGRMHMNAFLQAMNFYGRNLTADECEFCGVKDFAHDEKLAQRFQSWQEFDSQNGVFEIKFDDAPYPSAFIKIGAKARPRKMCKKASSAAKILLNHEFIGFETLDGGGVRAKFANGKIIETDALVLALGSDSMSFFAGYELPLSSVRGQVTHIKPLILGAPFSAKGYACPEAEGVQVIGATYDRNLFEPCARQGDDERNLADLSEFLGGKKPEILGSNVGFRSYSADRFAVVGRLHDEEFYKQSYKSLLWTKNKPNSHAKYVPNVYISTAHGSRGLGSAVLAAELICDLMFSRPLCVERTIFELLHGARFLIRKLKKGLVK